MYCKDEERVLLSKSVVMPGNTEGIPSDPKCVSVTKCEQANTLRAHGNLGSHYHQGG